MKSKVPLQKFSHVDFFNIYFYEFFNTFLLKSNTQLFLLIFIDQQKVLFEEKILILLFD